MGLGTPIIQVMRPAILFLLAATGCAQTFSSHGGWSFTDTLQTATDVLVGDIVSGTAVDDGSHVSVKATLRVVRVLGGNAAAGSDLAIQWQYRPMPLESPAVTSTVPKVRGLWFFRRTKGKLQPLQATVTMPSLSEFYLPAGDVPRYYSESTPLPYKVACEIAPVIEDLVARHSDDLGPHAPQTATVGGGCLSGRRPRLNLARCTWLSRNWAKVPPRHTRISRRCPIPR